MSLYYDISLTGRKTAITERKNWKWTLEIHPKAIWPNTHAVWLWFAPYEMNVISFYKARKWLVESIFNKITIFLPVKESLRHVNYLTILILANSNMVGFLNVMVMLHNDMLVHCNIFYGICTVIVVFVITYIGTEKKLLRQKIRWKHNLLFSLTQDPTR